MDAVFRGVAVYLFLFVVFRATGKRSLAQVTPFDFVLLLIVAETTQQALLGDDFSVTNAFLLIATLFAVDIGLSRWKHRSPRVDRVLDGVPTLLVRSGEPVREAMDREGIDEADLLQAARVQHGLQRMSQIRFAVLERSGEISVVPEDDAG